METTLLADVVAPARSITRHIPTVARVVFGLVFFVFGLDGFLHFIPPPEGPFPEGAMAFGGALAKTGYMFPLIKGTEVLVGALLLVRRFVPLALVIIAPVVVNIVAFHVFLSPSGLGVALGLAGIGVYLAWCHRAAYRAVLRAR